MLRFSARKPEVPSADKKPQQPHPEDRGDKTDHKLSKPTAPLVPPKKPVPPPGKGRPGSFPPKLPDKPLTPSTGAKHNGEVPSTRPKSDFEPTLPSKPKTLSGEWGDKALDMGMPKMPGRRLPAQFGGGHSPNKDISVEKTLKLDEEEAPKPKLIDTRKPSLSLSDGPKAYLASAPGHRSPSPSSSPVPSRSRSPGPSTEPKPMAEPEERRSELEDLQSQMKELLLSVELLKTQQM
ncbi:unnamed protein product [Coregonus sp. 'balchen']|nr:unnamed protein product [Coregonus sp. 'balchen']